MTRTVLPDGFPSDFAEARKMGPSQLAAAVSEGLFCMQTLCPVGWFDNFNKVGRLDIDRLASAGSALLALVSELVVERDSLRDQLAELEAVSQAAAGDVVKVANVRVHPVVQYVKDKALYSLYLAVLEYEKAAKKEWNLPGPWRKVIDALAEIENTAGELSTLPAWEMEKRTAIALNVRQADQIRTLKIAAMESRERINDLEQQLMQAKDANVEFGRPESSELQALAEVSNLRAKLGVQVKITAALVDERDAALADLKAERKKRRSFTVWDEIDRRLDAADWKVTTIDSTLAESPTGLVTAAQRLVDGVIMSTLVRGESRVRTADVEAMEKELQSLAVGKLEASLPPIEQQDPEVDAGQGLAGESPPAYDGPPIMPISGDAWRGGKAGMVLMADQPVELAWLFTAAANLLVGATPNAGARNWTVPDDLMTALGDAYCVAAPIGWMRKVSAIEDRIVEVREQINRGLADRGLRIDWETREIQDLRAKPGEKFPTDDADQRSSSPSDYVAGIDIGSDNSKTIATIRQYNRETGQYETIYVGPMKGAKPYIVSSDEPTQTVQVNVDRVYDGGPDGLLHEVPIAEGLTRMGELLHESAPLPPEFEVPHENVLMPIFGGPADSYWAWLPAIDGHRVKCDNGEYVIYQRLASGIRTSRWYAIFSTAVAYSLHEIDKMYGDDSYA